MSKKYRVLKPYEELNNDELLVAVVTDGVLELSDDQYELACFLVERGYVESLNKHCV
jgi:hypothetical protein